MAADIGLNARIASVKAVTATQQTWAARVYALLLAAVGEATNPFGTVAVGTTGTVAGRIPLLGAGGRFPVSYPPDRAADQVSGALIVPDSRADVNATPQVDQMPSVPASRFTTGVFHPHIIQPFNASRISGRMALARLPAAGGTANISSAGITVNTRVNTTRGSVTRFTDGFAAITRRAVSIVRTGNNVAVTLTFTARITQRGQDGD